AARHDREKSVLRKESLEELLRKHFLQNAGDDRADDNEWHRLKDDAHERQAKVAEIELKHADLNSQVQDSEGASIPPPLRRVASECSSMLYYVHNPWIIQ